MKFPVIVLAVFLISIYPLPAENSVKSRLDEDGGFYNRIRIENDFFRISLNSLFRELKFDWIEPAFKSDPLIIGRLNLKGIVRECFNPDSLTSESGVLLENSGITVTDSFSRSSRYGGALNPWDSPNILLWCFLNNKGLFDAGILLHEFAPVETLLPSWMKIETDFMINAGSTASSNPGSWFGDNRLMPEQFLFTPGAEIRLIAGETEMHGRKAMQPRSGHFTAAASVLGLYTVPQYTECGGLYRVYIVFGNRTLNLNGIFQATESGYVYPNGKQATNQLSAGAGLSLFTEIGYAEIETSCSYNYKLRNEKTVPSRSLGQTELFEIESRISIPDLLKISVSGEFDRSFDINGMEQRSSSAGFELSSSGFPISLGCEFDGEIDFSETDVLFNESRFRIDAGLSLDGAGVSGSLIFSEDETIIKNSLELSLDVVEFKAAATFGSEGITGLSLEVTSM